MIIFLTTFLHPISIFAPLPANLQAVPGTPVIRSVPRTNGMPPSTLFARRLLQITAGALLFLNIIESGVAAMIGMLGIGLIGASSVDRK